MSEEIVKKTKVLIPVSLEFDKSTLVKGLSIISKLREPSITVLHIIDLPVTSTLDVEMHKQKIEAAEKALKPLVDWIKSQSLEVNLKVDLARSITDGVIEETNQGDYDILILTKKKPPKGFKRLFYRSHTDSITGEVNCPTLILVRRV